MLLIDIDLNNAHTRSVNLFWTITVTEAKKLKSLAFGMFSPDLDDKQSSISKGTYRKKKKKNAVFQTVQA